MTEMWPQVDHDCESMGCYDLPANKPPTQESLHDGYFSDEVGQASPRETSLREFFHGIRGRLNGSAKGKGYARSGGDGTPLYDFVSQHVAGGGDSHAMGEMIYKIVEAANRPELKQSLMEKVAAWAFLVWEAEERGKL